MKNDTFAILTTKEYSRTDSGKCWKSKPDSIETKEINREFYDNMTSEETCKFFRRLGGSETVTRCYTSAGYIPIEIISCDPSRTVRKVRTFDIVADMREKVA